MNPGMDYIGAIAPYFCTDGAGNWLFYKRSVIAHDFQGYWDCSGGTINFGEQPEEAVLRKIRIQYRCTGEILSQLPARSIILEIGDVKYHWLAAPFIIKVDHDQVAVGEPDKMEEAGWFRLNALPAPLHPGARYIIDCSRDIFTKYS
jgi:ADP-ribose pyrophosphatase YjhB (NUDIX family)